MAMRRMRLAILAAIAVLVLGGGLAAATRSAPEQAKSFITDAHGRAIIAHGFSTNGGAKDSTSGLPDFTEEELAREHADMGTNFVRLLISWRAVEPEPGVYDEEYFTGLEEIVDWYAERDYHVMLDMHQDLWGVAVLSESGQHGNGAPEWATYFDGYGIGDHEQWELYYLDAGVVRAFDNFWNTTGEHPELIEHYIRAWQAVAERFADNEAVVAYDLMNEPYGGTVQGPRFESGPLTDLYQRTTDAIREVDPDSWVCLEPQALGYNWGVPTALGTVDDPRDGADRIAFCPHLYPLPMDLGGGYSGATKPRVDATIDAWVANTLRAAERLGNVPIILGEFGLDTTREGALDYVERVYAEMDSIAAGVVYWSRDDGAWGPYDQDKSPRNLVEALNRPYPRAVAGTPLGWHSEEGSLAIDMMPDPAIDAPTEVYLPPEVFGDGVEVTGAELLSWDAESGIAEVSAPPGSTDRLTITFTAR